MSGATQTAINDLAGAAATLTGAADLAATAHNAIGWTAFEFQGATYALYEDVADATAFANDDTLVELVGVTVADLAQANFA